MQFMRIVMQIYGLILESDVSDVLFSMVVGSNLWGTNHKFSDEDILKIVEPSLDETILGLTATPESKQNEFVYTTLKFHSMVKSGNPSALQYLRESVFTPKEENLPYLTDAWRVIFLTGGVEWEVYNSKILLNNLGRIKTYMSDKDVCTKAKDLLSLAHLLWQVDFILNYPHHYGLFCPIKRTNNGYKEDGVVGRVYKECLLHLNSGENSGENSNFLFEGFNEVAELYDSLLEKAENEWLPVCSRSFSDEIKSELDKVYLEWFYSHFKINSLEVLVDY